MKLNNTLRTSCCLSIATTRYANALLCACLVM